MSNSLAVATVTVTLCQLLSEAAEAAVPGTSAAPGRPRDTADGISNPGINVYLYQALPNAAWRNEDLPARRPDGTMARCPQAALDLHYLLTFYGSELQTEPQRLLGSAVSVLHARPVLTREMIRAAVNAVTGGDSGHYLAGSDLADSVEAVRLSPIPLNLEELSKLWSAFFQTPYALSAAYQASVVLIEAQGTPQSALPVRRPLISTVPFRRPLIERVFSQAGEGEPIILGSTLLIAGKGLRGESTLVRIGEIDVDSASGVTGDKEIALLLASPPFPAGSLRAGVQAVQVVHQRTMGLPPVARGGVESNAAAFVLRPVVTGALAPDASEMIATLDPAVGRSQRVVLLLNEYDPLPDRAARAYTFNAPKDNGIEDEDVDETPSVTFSMTGVEPGEYLVRVRVDGVESPLALDTDPDNPRYAAPRVTVP